MTSLEAELAKLRKNMHSVVSHDAFYCVSSVKPTL